MLGIFGKKAAPAPKPAPARRVAKPASQAPARTAAAGANNVVPLPTRAPAQPAAASPAVARDGVISQAVDLPSHVGVISGTDKNSIVKVTEAQEQMFCVIRTSQREAAVVAAPAFRKLSTDARLEVLSLVRSALQTRDIEFSRTLHATEEVLAGLLTDRSRTRAGNESEADAAKATEAGRLFQSWVSYGVMERATDIHIEVRENENVVHQRFRIEGELEPMRDAVACFPTQARGALSVAYNKLTLEGTGSHSNFMGNEYQYSMIPFEHGGKKYKLRVQTLPTDGMDFIMRILDIENKTYFPLAGPGGQGFEKSQEETMLRVMGVEDGGIIVFSGITGSGKTTAAKAMLDFQPGKEKKKRIGIEDPKEYDIDNYSGLSIQRDVGDPEASKRSYMEAYVSLMRSDLDLGYVGEIRDNVSANAALVIAESGHLAMGSNHARNLMGILPRLTSQSIGADLFAFTEPGVFRLMVNQALLGTLCKHCRIPLREGPQEVRAELDEVGDRFEVDTSGVYLRRAGGCEHCRGRGIKGMTVIAEVYEPTDDFLTLMRERKTRDAKQVWLQSWDGQFDTDNMLGKTKFEHAFLKMLRGDLDVDAVRSRATGGIFMNHLTMERKETWKH